MKLAELMIRTNTRTTKMSRIKAGDDKGFGQYLLCLKTPRLFTNSTINGYRMRL